MVWSKFVINNMKKMATINSDKVVTNIIVCEDDELETSNLVTYTDDNLAFIGGDYFEGYFYPPKQYPSWSRNGNGRWVPPIQYPNDNKQYIWNESIQQWEIVKTNKSEA
jgi:hypothetical protein